MYHQNLVYELSWPSAIPWRKDSANLALYFPPSSYHFLFVICIVICMLPVVLYQCSHPHVTDAAATQEALWLRKLVEPSLFDIMFFSNLHLYSLYLHLEWHHLYLTENAKRVRDVTTSRGCDYRVDDGSSLNLISSRDPRLCFRFRVNVKGVSALVQGLPRDTAYEFQAFECPAPLTCVPSRARPVCLPNVLREINESWFQRSADMLQPSAPMFTRQSPICIRGQCRCW
jgi:hypothetical protein